MKFKLMLNAALLAVTGVAHAEPLYLDLNNAPGFATYSGVNATQVCVTCTSLKDELAIKYRSTTAVTDSDGNGAISAGDVVNTLGGLAAGGGYAYNAVTDLNPGGFGGPSDFGFKTSWGISFSAALSGVVSTVQGGVPLFSYNSGVIDLYITFDGVTGINFMDIVVSSGGGTGVGTSLIGYADFSDVSNSVTSFDYKNLFHSASYSCNGSSGFYDIWANCGAVEGFDLVQFLGHFDSNVFVSQFSYDPVTNNFSLTSNHDGSFTFNVPEPGSVALAGLALLGAGLTTRRRRSLFD